MSTPEPNQEISREDLAFYMKSIWDALLAPSSSRDDLIELGKAIYAKTPLGKLSDQQFEQLFPLLSTMAQHLARSIKQRPTAPSPTPAEPSNG
jgi:hypothetical protein